MMESYATKLKWHAIDYTVAIERDVVASYLEPNHLRIVPTIAIFLDHICMLTGSVHFVEIVAGWGSLQQCKGNIIVYCILK